LQKKITSKGEGDLWHLLCSSDRKSHWSSTLPW